MLPYRFPLFALLAVAPAAIGSGRDATTPKIDKPRLEAYVRYAEGYTPNVKVQADDPTPSSLPGFSRVVVHASLGDRRLERTYYIASDGQRILSGNIWNVNQSPFMETLEHLPMNGPAFGASAPSVTIVIFDDFECPYCRKLAGTVRDNLPKKYPNEVQVVFADFPLEAIHKWARAAAEAAHCLGDSDSQAFWQFHDWIFEHQGEIDPANLKSKVLAYAKDKNLDVTKIGACIDSHATAGVVEKNEQIGKLLQVQETPTLFVNGRMLAGAVSWDTLEAVIKIELDRPKNMTLLPGSPNGK
jgi:protein-disulfide isomerase